MKGAAMYNSVQAAGSDVEVLQHVALVKRIAYHLMNKLPETVLVDDLIQAGMLGLLEASKNFDPAQGASFDTYAGIRIRGAMLDEVRRLDWTPRSVHKKARMVTEAIRAIENVTGRDAKGPEIAKHLGISIEDYHQILRDTMSSRTFSVEELAQTGDHFLDERANTDADPADRLSQDSFQKALANAILMLPERERLIVSLYYDDELNLREIGEVLGISESRVSQISSQAMLRLRSRLVEWIDSKS
jgi:RNA polymerase sigma factor FliA